MKFKVIAGFSFVLIILGVASLGTFLQDLAEGIRGDMYLGATVAAWFIGSGVLLYWAATKRYSAGWRIYLGAFLMFFGFVGASIETDNIRNLRAEDPVFGLVLAAAFVTAGVLLALSGYRRNLRRAFDSGDQPAATSTGWPAARPVSEEPQARSEQVVASGSSGRK